MSHSKSSKTNDGTSPRGQVMFGGDLANITSHLDEVPPLRRLWQGTKEARPEGVEASLRLWLLCASGVSTMNITLPAVVFCKPLVYKVSMVICFCVPFLFCV